jgi:hypothetical protein
MTFTAAKCGHNLPQTSLLSRKSDTYLVIIKKKIGCATRPPAAAARSYLQIYLKFN